MIAAKLVAALFTASITALVWSDREYFYDYAWYTFALVLITFSGLAVRELRLKEEKKKRSAMIRFFWISAILPIAVAALFPNSDFSGRHMGNILGSMLWIAFLVYLVIVSLATKQEKQNANQATHTTSANARLFHNDPMEINLKRFGTSTEAAIVWI